MVTDRLLDPLLIRGKSLVPYVLFRFGGNRYYWLELIPVYPIQSVRGKREYQPNDPSLATALAVRLKAQGSTSNEPDGDGVVHCSSWVNSVLLGVKNWVFR